MSSRVPGGVLLLSGLENYSEFQPPRDDSEAPVQRFRVLEAAELLWDEYKVVVTLVRRVRRFTIALHPNIVPQASLRLRLKARGFNHPRVGH